jgi:hypothetical protein
MLRRQTGRQRALYEITMDVATLTASSFAKMAMSLSVVAIPPEFLTPIKSPPSPGFLGRRRWWTYEVSNDA